MQLVTKDELLAVPLFHATSDFFAALILESGLGAKNVITEWRVVEFAHDVANLLCDCGVDISTDPERHLTHMILQPMVDQEVTEAGFNFRHGSVYLSAARSDAMRYAVNRKGSELLSYIEQALSTIPPSRHSEIDALLARFPEARRALEACHNPVLITAHNVPISALRTEQGGDPRIAIRRAEEFAVSLGQPTDGGLLDAVLQQCRFELVGNLPPSSLVVTQIDRSELDV